MQSALSAREIYQDYLLLGEQVELKFNTRRDGENFRVSLVKLHQELVRFDGSSESVCADWDETTSCMSFWLGQSRRPKGVIFELVSHGSNKLRSTLGDDSNESRASEGSVSRRSIAREIDSWDSAEENQSERES